MKEMLGDRLPTFTAEELAIVHGSSEFYGMNTYTTNLTREAGITGDEFQGRAEYTFTRPKKNNIVSIRASAGESAPHVLLHARKKGGIDRCDNNCVVSTL